MAELLITDNELSKLNQYLEIPVELHYQDHHLLLTGNYRIVVQKQFQLRLAFLKMSGTRIIFEVVESTPSFGILDSIIKSSLLHWIQKFKKGTSDSREIVSVEYLFITLDIGSLPGVDGMFEYLTIDGIDFEDAGIRVRFHMLTLPQAVPI